MKKYFWALLFLAAASAGVRAQSDVRQFDFRNFTYEPYCVRGPYKITVKNGRHFEESGKVSDYRSLRFTMRVETYGDIDGDGREEAVITGVCNEGGENYSEGFVYTMKQDQPVLLTRIEGGAMALNGIRSITVREGIVTVDRFEGCCREFAAKTKYKWDGTDLVQVGEPETRRISTKKRS